ncbi:hypothetical protein [Nocardia sp. NBC_01009]|uniref:hypothetical protein n=1 Tax=Nocardia sp. NBC_01009 TaxID=2975996 RepID=UPI003865B9A5|nr:hypothetical protein OHA42_17630 [Nocardia sp. NBC_01009]
MARFRLESHIRVPNLGVMITQIALDDLDELVEHARIWALEGESERMWLYDRSVELFTIEGRGVALVDAIDRWAHDRPLLCGECGEMLHAARIAGEPAWYCHGCDYRTQAA